MSDLSSPENQETISRQSQLESLWKRPEAWQDGYSIKTEGLPEGMRILESSEHMILRSVMPGIPQTDEKKGPSDVPVAIYSTRTVTPAEIIKEAIDLAKEIIEGNVRFVSPNK